MLKTKRIGLMVNKEEKRWVIELARLEGGLSQASLIRRLIHKAAVERRLTTIEIYPKSTQEKEYEYTFIES
jgi:hypothetical protein